MAREVREEVDVVVSQLRYVGSQAWPYPASLMLGFVAYADPAQEVRPDQLEIAEARWFTRAEIAAILAGEPAPVLASCRAQPRSPTTSSAAGSPMKPRSTMVPASLSRVVSATLAMSYAWRATP